MIIRTRRISKPHMSNYNPDKFSLREGANPDTSHPVFDSASRPSFRGPRLSRMRELEPRPGRLWNSEGRTTKSPTSNSYRYSSQALNTSGPQRRAQCLQSPETNGSTSIPSERSSQCEEVLRKALSSEGLPHLWGHRTLSPLLLPEQPPSPLPP